MQQPILNVDSWVILVSLPNEKVAAKTVTEASLEKLKRLLSSLNLVMAIYFCTWFLTILMLVLTQIVKMEDGTVQLINQQLAWLVIINASFNFFIYNWRAPEYRYFLFIL